jgi:hypothetical protein
MKCVAGHPGAIAVEVVMWKKWAAVVCLMAFLGAGCSTMGEVTGKTVKGVENAAGDFKDGYRKGRSE